MNKIVCFFIFSLLVSRVSLHAQEKLMNIEINGKSVPVLISDGDTMMILGLETVNIQAPHKFQNFGEEALYMKYKRYAVSVFPYAVKAIKVFRALEKDTEK